MEFKHGETQRNLRIPIVDDMEFEKDENFEIELYEANGGAKIGKINKTAVTITNDDGRRDIFFIFYLLGVRGVDV